MKHPRLSIRVFLALCLLLGAVGIPWAWKAYQARKAAEIERLQKELGKAYVEQPPLIFGFKRQPSDAWEKWQARVEKLEVRVEELTGVKPTRPQRRTIESF